MVEAARKEEKLMSAKASSDVFEYRNLMLVAELDASSAERLFTIGQLVAETCDPVYIDAFWIPAEHLHVKILDLGRVREDLVDLVAKKMKAEFEEMAPIPLAYGDFELYSEDPNPVEALWVKVPDEGGGLAQARKTAALILSEMENGEGFLSDVDSELPFHLPLALFNKFRDTREFGGAITSRDPKVIDGITLGELVLMDYTDARSRKNSPFQAVDRFNLEKKEQ